MLLMMAGKDASEEFIEAGPPRLFLCHRHDENLSFGKAGYE